MLRLSRSCADCEVSSPDGRANIAVARASSKSKQGRTKERNPRKVISGARNRWKSGVSHPADLSSRKRRRDRGTRSEERCQTLSCCSSARSSCCAIFSDRPRQPGQGRAGRGVSSSPFEPSVCFGGRHELRCGIAREGPRKRVGSPSGIKHGNRDRTTAGRPLCRLRQPTDVAPLPPQFPQIGPAGLSSTVQAEQPRR